MEELQKKSIIETEAAVEGKKARRNSAAQVMEQQIQKMVAERNL